MAQFLFINTAVAIRNFGLSKRLIGRGQIILSPVSPLPGNTLIKIMVENTIYMKIWRSLVVEVVSAYNARLNNDGGCQIPSVSNQIPCSSYLRSKHPEVDTLNAAERVCGNNRCLLRQKPSQFKLSQQLIPSRSLLPCY